MKNSIVKSVEELLEKLENDSEETPIGIMQEVGAHWRGAWRYTVVFNSIFLLIEGSIGWGIRKSPEDTYTVCYNMIHNTAKEQAMRFSGKVIDVPYGEDNEKWLRFDKLEDAAHFLLSL